MRRYGFLGVLAALTVITVFANSYIPIWTSPTLQVSSDDFVLICDSVKLVFLFVWFLFCFFLLCNKYRRPLLPPASPPLNNPLHSRITSPRTKQIPSRNLCQKDWNGSHTTKRWSSRKVQTQPMPKKNSSSASANISHWVFKSRLIMSSDLSTSSISDAARRRDSEKLATVAGPCAWRRFTSLVPTASSTPSGEWRRRLSLSISSCIDPVSTTNGASMIRSLVYMAAQSELSTQGLWSYFSV